MLDVVQPLAATLGGLTAWILLLPDVRRVRWVEISALLATSTLFTPAGIALLGVASPDMLLHGAGALIAGQAVLSVALTFFNRGRDADADADGEGDGISAKHGDGGGGGGKSAVGGRARAGAATALAALAGVMAGALDMPGPAVVVHGNVARWSVSSGAFRRNMLAFVAVNSTLVVLCDAFAGRLDDFYYGEFLRDAVPGVLIGVVVGSALGKRIDAGVFRKLVLGLSLIMGCKLLLS